MEDWKATIQKQIDELKLSLTGDMWKDMELKGKIHGLEMKLKSVRPEFSNFECVGCGS